MKIVVAPADYAGCGFYRILVPYMALRDRGYDVTFVDNKRDPLISKADVLVLQRQIQPDILELARAFQKRGGRVVYEMDDNFHTLPSDNPCAKEYGSGRPATKIGEAFVREADAVVVSTPDIASEYARFRAPGQRPIDVCYNAVKDEHVERFRPFGFAGAPKRRGEIRVGWAGSNTHWSDLRLVARSLTRAMTAHPEVRVVFIGADMRVLFPIGLRGRCEYAGDTFVYGRPLTRADIGETLPTIRYYERIRASDFDIAIAPIVSSTFTRCKSFLKTIEYGMLGIPTVASNFGPYRQYKAEYDARNVGAPFSPVLLADTEWEWTKALRRLIESQSERSIVGNVAAQYVAGAHTISAKIEQWQRVIDALAPVSA